MAVNSNFETIEHCRICSASDLVEILNLGNQPPANSLYLPEEEPPASIPLRLFYCTECKTLQLRESVDPYHLFSKYVWVTGTSKTAVEYSYTFAQEALKRSPQKAPFVIEIASNDGTFLRRFQEKSCKVLGIDPAENLAKAAVDESIPTLIRFFSEKVSQELIETHGQADIVIARNVLPHVREVHSVVKGIGGLLKPNGLGIIEFHDSKLILEELQYDYIYHEHLFYFTLSSMESLLLSHGLKIFDIYRSPISGGSWVVYFSHKTKAKTSALKMSLKDEDTSAVNSLETWLDFRRRAKIHREKLREITFSSNTKILAYGASARSSTLLNFCKIGHDQISAIVDKNPLKHGLLTPMSKIPIISYEQGIQRAKAEELILLLAWNFKQEVKEDLCNCGYKGRFLLPLPGKPCLL